MATIIHRNRDRSNGIWLLDKNALLEIDEIIEDEWQNLKEIKEQKIIEERDIRLQNKIGTDYFREQFENLSKEEKDKYINEIRNDTAKSYPYNREIKEVVIKLKSGQKIITKTFKEAIENPLSFDQIPVSFELKIEVGIISANLELDNNYLTIATSPETNHLANTIFIKFEQWAEQYKNNKIIIWWKESTPFVQISGTFIVTMIALPNSIRTRFPALESLQERALKLVEGGISNNEINQSIDIVIKSLVIPDKTRIFQIEPWLWFFLFFYGCAFLISLFPPTSGIGIGKGIHTVKSRKKWLKFVTTTIPIFIIMGVLSSFFGSLLFEIITKKP